MRPSRHLRRGAGANVLLGALAVAAIVVCVAGVARTLRGTSSPSPRGGREPAIVRDGRAPVTLRDTRARSAVGDTSTPTSPISVESPDPEADVSFAAPPSVRHAAAIAPASAGALVAPGAPSDAEVRAELAQAGADARAQAAAAQDTKATISADGLVTPPAGVPLAIDRVIAGANVIAKFPYLYGGGHASFVDDAYDCSGSVGYALAAAGLLSAPEASGQMESWGVPGPGRWLTIYTNAGHVYMFVDGLRYDTAGRTGVYSTRWQIGSDPGGGPDNTGFVARHWPGL